MLQHPDGIMGYDEKPGNPFDVGPGEPQVAEYQSHTGEGQQDIAGSDGKMVRQESNEIEDINHQMMRRADDRGLYLA